LLRNFMTADRVELELTKAFRRLLAEFLVHLGTGSRKGVLGYKNADQFMVPPAVSPAATDQIASDIVEICRDWRWS
jgi:hypothetical protein